jgi:hypothetical protein
MGDGQPLCSECEGSGQCGFCQGADEDDCPYDCTDGECVDCGGTGTVESEEGG